MSRENTAQAAPAPTEPFEARAMNPDLERLFLNRG